MNHFNRLVSEQMMTMDQLLSLQGEIERCQEIENELLSMQKKTEAEAMKQEIHRLKKELCDIQLTFEKQTEEVIQSYLEMEITPV